MITGIDHIALAVADLEAGTAAYEALLGRPAERTEPAGGARRAWLRLENLAIEIIAAEGEGPAGDRVRARLAEQGEGLLAIAFATSDLEAAVKLCERRGLSVAAAPGTALKAAFIAPESSHGLPLALCEAEPIPRSALTDGAALHALDHVVVQTPNPDRAAALYGARLGLYLRLDRTNPAWNSRLLFFRCGKSVVEIGHGLDSTGDGPDRFGGLAWRTRDPHAARERIAAAGFNVSEVRQGRKPGTHVFTVRDRTAGVPTLVLSAASD
ncbi:VOC family protein [Phenylobacterium montanum]|uniref:VOC family protein n=1 Tax=Phenylobacterium montanum TaxID=2823693 RepID=A0A975FWR4_9CAUL|nr:VOC family protein [Caulobacter sp. S6]QUD86674.1 VOC family protein [Caulobacter sp. S6]